MVRRHAQANGHALGVAQAARHFLGGFQNEGVRARCARFNAGDTGVVYPRVAGQLSQVAAQQGEVVFVVYAADAAHASAAPCRPGGRPGRSWSRWAPPRCRLAQQRYRLLEQARLRVVGVNLE